MRLRRRRPCGTGWAPSASPANLDMKLDSECAMRKLFGKPRSRRRRQRSKPEDPGAESPPAWEAIPPTVMLAAQPDSYLRMNKKQPR